MDIINNDDFLNVINSKFKDGSAYTFYMQTWQDGDNFLDTCMDDGGIKSKQLLLFNERNQTHIIYSKTDLLELTEKYIKNKSFVSKNEVYKLGYEIYIICKNDYFVLCPELNKGYYKKLNFINRFIGFFDYKEPWQNEKFGYWEKRRSL